MDPNADPARRHLDPAADGPCWFHAGQTVLADGDGCLSVDDFDGACRRFLLAAYCFARAWCAGNASGPGREYRSAYRYALYAAQPLLPDTDPLDPSPSELEPPDQRSWGERRRSDHRSSESHSSSSRTGSP